MKLSNHSIGARMATALGLVLALLLGAALFGAHLANASDTLISHGGLQHQRGLQLLGA